jgi:hypothetical protein
VIVEGSLFGYDIFDYNISLFLEIIAPVTMLERLGRAQGPVGHSHCDKNVKLKV